MLIDFVYHSTLGLRVIKKKMKKWHDGVFDEYGATHNMLRIWYFTT